MGEARFNVLAAIEREKHEDDTARFLRHPRTQIAIGAGLKSGAAMELSAIRKRDASRRNNPTLFPEMEASEREADHALRLACEEQYQRGERYVSAGRAREIMMGASQKK